MCGRYTLFSDTENTEIKKMVEEVNRKYNVQIKIGDISPSHLAPIIRANTMELLKEDTTALIMKQIQTVKSSS